MQAFLHFSAATTTDEIKAFIQEMMDSYQGVEQTWLSLSKEIGAAAFCEVPSMPSLAPLRNKASALGIDVNQLPDAPYLRKLMLCDMDSTIITGESLDELSELAGIGPQVAAITARAMAGDYDFRQALAERLALLTGTSAKLLDRLVAETKGFVGAGELVTTMRDHGAHCLLVSGGFTFLTQDIAARFGFHEHFANHLAIEDDKIAGYVCEPVIDKTAKLQILQDYSAKLHLTSAEVMSLGDGANDIPMLKAASLGIAWQAKPLVKSEIALQLSHSSLCGPLFLQGISEKDITSPSVKTPN